MIDLPKGFPLEPKDCNNQKIRPGDKVKILKISEWLINNLDNESKEIVTSCEGKEMIITEIDDYGYAWVEIVNTQTDDEYINNSFSLEPKNLMKL